MNTQFIYPYFKKFCSVFKIQLPIRSETNVKGTANFMNTWLVSKPYDYENIESEAVCYFDDRIFNRNYDDYNDIMGLFDVKMGIETINKYVTAETYVYSENAKSVRWQFAGSGVYTLFCNGKAVGKQKKSPEDVRKSGVKYSVRFNAGWNKLTVKIKHINPNKECNLFGFYSRLCDGKGNTVNGLTYSVDGPTATLKIATRGITLDKVEFLKRNNSCPANTYFDNELPIAYEKNPYVWFKAKLGDECFRCQASPFGFQASGGTPPYNWAVTDGSLPSGLTLLKDGAVDGIISDKTANNSEKDYKFTLTVTDKNGSSASKEFSMTVKVNPVQWFEQGRMAALSHCTGTIPNLYDPNYNYDDWAKTAKEMGLTMLSTESYQNTLYYWPSPNADLTPDDSNVQYKYNTMYQKENGEWAIIDRVGQAKKAAERQGLHFGTYLSPQRPQTDIVGLVKRYDPWYIFVDGNPQNGVNLDIAFSSARNYNDRVLFVTNPDVEVADQDITLMERGFWNSAPYNEDPWRNNILPEGKYYVHEEWNDPFGTALNMWKIWTPNSNQTRDSWPDATMELVNIIGHGYVMNHDLTISGSRGLDTFFRGDEVRTEIDKDNVYMMVPLYAQQMSDMRRSMVTWLNNENGCDLHESLFGTMPYYIKYTPKKDWHEPGTQQAFFHGEGPEWGYALSRDENVYLHLIKNQIQGGRDKKGYNGDETLKNIGPFEFEVKSVLWMNKNKKLPFTTEKQQDGYYINIDMSFVVADPIDTVIKITTANPEKTYKMTGVKLFSNQENDSELKLRSECYMNDYVSFTVPATLKYSIDNPDVADVNDSGIVTAKSDGEAKVTVTAEYNGVIKNAAYPITVKNGKIRSAVKLVGVSMYTNGKPFWNEVSPNTKTPVELVGFSEDGETVTILHPDSVKYHYGKINASTKIASKKIEITETDENNLPISIENGYLNVSGTGDRYYCYWADVTVNSEKFTTSRNFITLLNDRNVAGNILPSVSENAENAQMLTDGIINDTSGGNALKWTAAGDNPTVTFDLQKAYDLTRINLFFNRHMPRFDAVTYYNVPKKIVIEYSQDGKNWTLGNTLSKLSGRVFPDPEVNDQIPTNDETSYAWEAENLFYNYPIDKEKKSVNARYVRISFPDGGQNGKPVDILEIKIFAAEY